MAAYGALVSLSHTLHQILHPPPLNKINIDREQIEFFKSKVSFIIDFLETHSSIRRQEIADLETKIVDAAYEAEDIVASNVVDQIRSNISTLFYKFLTLCGGVYAVPEKLIFIEKEVLEKFLFIEKELLKMREVVKDLKPKGSTTYKWPPSGGKITMVGIEDRIIRIMDALATDESNLRIIPIVGMGGIGKTSLALAVYNHAFAVERFDVRAWVTVSQGYTGRVLLLWLLSEIIGVDHNKLRYTDEEIGELLYKELFDRRYLIVMDDMWDIEDWEKVRRFIPGNENGSRILITTRLSRLADDLGSSNPYHIDLLDEEKSWHLLCGEIFGKEDCPIELEKIGKNIARKCGGLPLALVLIGGLLAKSEWTKEHWKDIEGDVTSALNYENDEQLMEILSLSYIHLPLNLKPCFLYLAMFQKYNEIGVSMLIRMWVGEGLIKPTKDKCSEEVAHEYLEDLVSRNLILIHKRGSSGKVRSCKIHDLIMELCIIKAEEEKFRYIAKIDNLNGSPNLETKRRLSNQVINRIKLLKIWRDMSGKVDISTFINLRCVVAKKIISISSMSFCWNIQTIDVLEGNENLPVEIWQMPQLRHLKMYAVTLHDPPPDDRNMILENLQTLQTIKNFKLTKEVLRRIPNLKKLKILYHVRSSAACVHVANYGPKNLVCFKKLESLQIHGAEILWRDIIFPISLKKLSLGRCKIPWEDMSIVGLLPNLQVLKLHDDATKGEEWNPIEEEFCQLKFLQISGCELKIWGAENYHFPCLEHLVLEDVMSLEEIPISFAEILTLQVISLRFVKSSLTTSAREISKERELLGYEPLQLDIYKKIVLKVSISNDKEMAKALKTAASFLGVESIRSDMKDKKLILVGDVDPIHVVEKLRKCVGYTELASIGPAEE